MSLPNPLGSLKSTGCLCCTDLVAQEDLFTDEDIVAA